MRKQNIKIFSLAFKRLEESFNQCLFSLNRNSGKPSCPPSTYKKILIARLDSIGDFVLFSTCLAAYRRFFPNAWLVLLVKDNVYNLAETCPYVNEVWCVTGLKFRLNILERLRWYKKLSTAGFDLVINAAFSCSFSYLDCLMGWTGAPRRIAFRTEGTASVDGRQRQYFTEFVSAEEGKRFEIDRNFEMLHHLGFRGNTSHKTEVWITDDDQRVSKSLCSYFNGMPYAIVFPGAQIEKKRWPAEYFVEAIRQIHNQYPLQWAICGSTDEAELCSFIATGLAQSSISNVDLSGKTSLRVLAAITKGAQFYLGNDTSGAHIAAAVDTPAICILGGGHAGRFFPYPESELTLAVTHELPCHDCDWQCSRPATECITDVKVDVVVEQVVELIKHNKVDDGRCLANRNVSWPEKTGLDRAVEKAGLF